MAVSKVFDETYEAYLSRIGDIDLEHRQAILGYEFRDGQAVIPFFNTTLYAGSRGIFDRYGKTPDHSVSVVLFRYLLMCPDQVPPSGGLAAFKDFRDAAPLIHFFANTVQGDVVRKFVGNTPALEKACLAVGGEPYTEDVAYQVKYRFRGLPRICLFLFFNDAEEGFDAQCSILFERSTEAFLDMESVAMLGGALSRKLIAHEKSGQ
jgi:hypothetical protein